MDLQKKWDGVWKMKFIQQYKNLSKEIYILFFDDFRPDFAIGMK